MPAKDLRVQIAGDEAQLNRALDRAEGRMTKYTASVDAQAGAQARAYERAGASADYAGRSATQFAMTQEAVSRRVKAGVADMLASHSAAMQKVGDNTVAAGRKVNATGSSILSMVAPIDLAGAAAGKLAVDFNKAMELLHTQANYSQRDVEALSKSVEKLSPKVGSSPKELAEGLYHVASAGIPASKAMEVLEQGAMGAKLGGADLEKTLYALVSLLKSAPKDIHGAADAMAEMNAIVGQGDMKMEQLVEALSTGVIPAAKGAGLGLRDVGAAMDVLTARGIPAEVAGTRLRMTFAFMEKQSSTAKKALEEIGITQDQLGEDMRKPNGLLVAVEDLKTHLADSGKTATEQNKTLLTAFGGGRSAAAIQALVQNLGDLRKQYATLPEGTAAVKRFGQAWADLQNTPAQKLAKDQQEVNVALIEMGKDILPAVLPIAKDLSGTVGELARDFEDLSGGQKQAIIDFALAGTAVGLIAKPLGGLLTTVGFLEKGLGVAGSAAGKFTRTFGGSLETVVPVAEEAGMQAGTAYGTAFAAAADRGVAEVRLATAGAAGSGRFMTPMGWGYPTGAAGKETGVPGFGPYGFTAAEQEKIGPRYGLPGQPSPSEIYAMANSPSTGERFLSGAKSLAGNALKGGAIAGGGYFASELAGNLVGGKVGSDISSIGSGASIGAGIGTVIAPGLGTAIGAALGAAPGVIKALEGPSGLDQLAHNAKRGLPNYGAAANKQIEDSVRAIRKREEKELGELQPPNRGARSLGTRGTPDHPGPGRTPYEEGQAQSIKDKAGYGEGQVLGEQESAYIKSKALLPNLDKILNVTANKFKTLGPAARDGMYNAMLGMVRELEKQGRLPAGATQKFIDVLHAKFSTLGTYSKEAAAKTVSEWDLMKKGGAALKSANDFVGQILGAQKQIPLSAKTTEQEAGKFFTAGENELLQIAKHSTGERHKLALDAYHQLRAMDKAYYEQQNAEAASKLGQLNSMVKDLSSKGRKAFLSEWQATEKPLKELWEAGYLTTSEYTKKMAEVVTGELTSLGVKPNAIGKKAAKFGVGPGSANPFVSGLPEGVGHATGSWIGNRGERGRDMVPIWAGAGEAIVNHDQQGPVEVGLAVSKMLGVQPYGSLNELFAGERKPHYMASGGVVAPHVNIPGQVGMMAQAGLNLEARTANALLRHLGHAASAAGSVTAPGGAPTGGGYDPSQTGYFEGIPVAKWIIPENLYARAHGWTGPVTSGIRLGFDPHAPGGSEHALNVYPGGAEDFGGMVDPAGLANRAAFIRATAGYTGRRLLTPIGFRDDGHMSGTGHALGGFAYASGGQIHQAEAEATNKRLHGKFAGTTAMLRDLWTAAAPYYHASGKPMRSPIYTSGSDGLFVGVEQGAGRRPGHRNLYIPDWVVEGGKGDLNLGGRAPEALQLILHEWAHEYQSQSALARAARRVPKGVSVLGEGGRAVTAEGGAQAFAQMVGPAILAKAGMGDVHPRNYSAGDTYYQATDWVEKGLGSKWVRDGQFGYADGGFVGAPQMAGGGYVATAYGPPWGGIEGGGTTATGVDLGNAPHKYIIAVDPSEIPLGSEVKVWPNPFGYTGNFLAADTGGAIKGKRIDFYDWEGRAHQNAWGRRPVTVSVSGSVTGGSKKKAPSGLHLSGHQESTVQGYLGGAASEKSARVDFATKAGDVSGALEAGKARWAAQPADLKTSAGEHTAAARAEQVTISDKDVLRYYRDELKALQKEAKKWAKLRTFFRHLARRVHGSTKKQALDKAASYNAKITQAQSDAKTLKGTIYAQETTVIEAEGAEQAIPGEAKAAQANAAAEAAQGHESQLSGDLSAYQSDNSKVDLEVRAGVKTAAEGKAAKEANARKAEAGGYGELSPEGLLQVKGDLKELGEAAQDATSAIEAHTQAVKDNAKALDEYTKIASSENAIAAATFAKALADMVSGQLGGRPQVAGAGRGVPSGSAARY